MLKWIKNKFKKLWSVLLSEVGSTSYPTGLDSYTTKNAGDTVASSHVNNLQDAVVAAQTKLGIDSSAVVSTIDYFLRHASGAYRLHHHDGTSDDGAKLDWDTVWSDAVHDHSSAGEGGTSISGASLALLTALTIANNVDIGNYQLRMKQLYSDVPTGTAPLVIDSTTVVNNLNVDQVDGVDLPATIASVLTDHDTAAHDALNIDADTLDAAHASATPSNGIIVIADASGFLHTPSSAPDADYEVANKKYVDDNTYTSYDSGWFAAATGGTYTKTHSLGTTKLMIILYYSDQSDGSSNVDVDTWSVTDSVNEGGGAIQDVTTTQLTVQAASVRVHNGLDSSGDWVSFASGYYRVVAIAL